jgi:hypothetical protein
VRLEMSRVDHDGLLLGAFGGQALHHTGKDTYVSPRLPSVVERLRWAIIPIRLTPPQTIAIEQDYAAQTPPIIDERLAKAP